MSFSHSSSPPSLLQGGSVYVISIVQDVFDNVLEQRGKPALKHLFSPNNKLSIGARDIVDILESIL